MSEQVATPKVDPERPVASVEPGRPARVILLDAQGGDGSRKLDVPRYGTKKREEFNLQLVEQVDLVAQAASILAQKVAAMSWSVEGPERVARQWQQTLLPFWTEFVQQLVDQLVQSSKGAYAQIVRYCPSWAVDGEGTLTERGLRALEKGEDAAWEVAFLQVLDSRQCTPSDDPEFPLTYQPAGRGAPVKLRRHQFIHLIDSPRADAKHPGWGRCAVDRCLQTALTRRGVSTYFRECLEDKPKSGLVALSNVMKADWDAIMKSIETGQAQEGVQYYGGMVVLTNSVVNEPIGVQTIPFRITPEGFDQRETYTECKEGIATAFGLDPMEFGSMPGEQLGSAQQATVMAKKSRGKLLALILEGLERELSAYVIPPSCEFQFIAHDIEEELEEANLQTVIISNILRLIGGNKPASPGNPELGIPATPAQTGLITQEQAAQMLADRGIIPHEFLTVDVIDTEEVEDTDASETAREQRVKCFSDGRILRPRPRRVQPVRVAEVKAPPSSRHPRKHVQAVVSYQEHLREIYDDWAKEAARQLAEADPEDREKLLVALLALLLYRLKRAGARGLEDAFELGLGGEIPNPEDLVALQAAIDRNEQYLSESLLPDVAERFRKDAASAGFDWSQAVLLASLGSLAWRTARYGGAFWATLGLGVSVGARRRDHPVRRFLDPAADHCDSCPGKEGEYANWDEMVARCGGVPGDGSDTCDGNCRCGVEEEIAGQWVAIW